MSKREADEEQVSLKINLELKLGSKELLSTSLGDLLVNGLSKRLKKGDGERLVFLLLFERHTKC